MNEQEQPLSTLGQSIVPNGAPVVTQDAVQKLIDAFHSGYITTNDVMEHTGAVAAMKGKTALDLLKISPDIIQAQKTKANLETAQAQAQIGLTPSATELAKAQTEAQLGLVQPTAELAKTKTAQELATTNYGPALAKYLQYGNPPVYIKDKNGNPVRDYQTEAIIGNRYTQYENLAQWAQAGLTPVKPEGEERVLANGQKVLVWTNKFGENITPSTPDNPNPTFDEYQQHRRDALNFLFRNHDEVPVHPSNLHVSDAEKAVTGASVLPVNEPPAPRAEAISPRELPEIQPSALPPFTPSTPDEARAWLAQAGAMSVPAASTLTDPMAAYQSYVAHTSAAPAPQSTIKVEPAATGPVITIEHKPTASPKLPFPGFLQGPAPGTLSKPEDILKNLREQDAYKTWSQSRGEISEVNSLASDPNFVGKTPAQQNKVNMNDFDLRLGKAIASLTNPKTAEGRSSYVLQDLDLHQPYLNRYVENVKEVLLGRGKFSPQVRADLLRSAQQIAAGREATAKDTVKNAVDLFQKAGVPPKPFMTDEELALTQGAAPAAATGESRLVTYGGRQFRVGF